MKNTQVYDYSGKELFHIHTHRCKHSSSEADVEYVEKAIELGARKIVFTDHAPFPDNPFGNRMDIEELPEYIDSLAELKNTYKKKIEVRCGLEIEYLPSFRDYYLNLKKMDGIDLLMIGQHFFEHYEGNYSFSDEDKTNEFIGLCESMVQGINTGLFDVVAHPDRAFRRCRQFGHREIEAAKSVIWAAVSNGVYLEKNYSSVFLSPSLLGLGVVITFFTTFGAAAAAGAEPVPAFFGVSMIIIRFPSNTGNCSTFP